MDVLTPCRCPNENHSVGINTSYSSNDIICIRLHKAPSDSIGLIADLVQDMLFVLVELCHVRPERKGICLMFSRACEPMIRIPRCEHMPINHDIDTKLLAPVYDVLDGIKYRSLCCISSFTNIHRCTEQVDAPMLNKILNGLTSVASREPVQAVRGHAHQLYSVPSLVNQLGTHDPQLPMPKSKSTVVDTFCSLRYASWKSASAFWHCLCFFASTAATSATQGAATPTPAHRMVISTTASGGICPITTTTHIVAWTRAKLSGRNVLGQTAAT
mmetsp:Transcript_64340/g.122743  ORF Transcript_64340/g.122743 Transcript_64340/m.122743 type:complete len:272 (+) Transcript_64340:2431-3246(+)